MSFLLRHACRRSRFAWQRQQQENADNVASSQFALRQLTTDARTRDDNRHSSSPAFPVITTTAAASSEWVHLEFDSKLRLSSVSPSTVSVTSASIGQPSLSTQSAQKLLRDQPSLIQRLESLPLTFAPVSIGGVPAIAPPLPPLSKTEIREPAKRVSIVISDGLKEKAAVGDQPTSYTNGEVIGDKMDNVVKKEAIRILQIRRTKMNRHKLRKWRRKYRHLIKKKIEEKEKRQKKEMDDSLAAIRGDADAFNPVDKVRQHIALAKEMGYKVTYYEDLAVTKWLKEKEAEDVANSKRFVDKNTERYRKYPPWEYEKF